MAAPPLDLRSQLEHINRFLAGVYPDQEIRRLSDLLRQAGAGDTVIAVIRRQHLSAYLSRLSQRWRDFIAGVLSERHADIVIRRYALDGRPPPRLADLGAEYGISRERVRQLEQAGVKRLRSRKRRQALQRIALEVACEVAGLLPEGTPGAAGAAVERPPSAGSPPPAFPPQPTA